MKILIFLLPVLALTASADESEYSVGLKMRQTMNALQQGSHEASRELSSSQVERVLNESKGDPQEFRKRLQKERDDEYRRTNREVEREQAEAW